MQCIASLPNWPQLPCDCLVVGVPDDWKNAIHVGELDASLSGLLTKLLESGDVSTKANKLTTLLAPVGIPAKQLVMVGLGASSDWDANTAFRAAGYRCEIGCESTTRTCSICWLYWLGH
jgi:hypothetical protein